MCVCDVCVCVLGGGGGLCYNFQRITFVSVSDLCVYQECLRTFVGTVL